MLEAVLKRIKYVKERSHPAKNWMAFIVVFFCYLVFCIFGDWRVCVLCVFCVAVFLTVFSVCHCVMLSGQLCQKCFRFLRTAENLCLVRQLDVVDQDFRSLRSWTIWLIISLSKRSIRLSVLILKAPRERVEVRRAVLLSRRSNGTHSSRNWLTACRVSGEAVSGSVRSSW